MPKRKGAAAMISNMVGDDFSEDEIAMTDADMMPTPDSGVENRAQSRRKGVSAKGRVATTAAARATKAVKATPAQRRAGGATAVGGKRAPTASKGGRGRPALAERPNPSDTEEVDDFEAEEEYPEEKEEQKEQEEQVAPPKPKRGRPAKSAKKDVEMPAKAKQATKGPGRVRGATAGAGANSRIVKPPPSEEREITIPETQQEPDEMDVEPSIENIEEPEALPIRPSGRNTSRLSQRKPLQPQLSSRARRAGSASDTERTGSDPVLRRRLGDTTKHLQSMTMKYENLREVAIREQESNFDRLKRATDQRAKDQESVIESLRKELEEQKALARESKNLRARLAEMESENNRLEAEIKRKESALHNAQSEAKTLSTKLAATRSTASEPPRAPGSAVKPRAAVVGGSDAQIRQLKEDLYGDLTGLIIRSIKRNDEGEDVYDCIQTGRNGTLHFHLSVASEDTAQSYEDAEFAYEPLLDENRDRELIDILPDYLQEEICFPRSSAAKFYAKVVDCMTKKIVFEDDE